MHTRKRGGVLKILGTLLPLLTSGYAMAEGPAISGYVDTQWGYDFNQPKNRTTALRSYDAQDNNIRNTAHLSFAGSLDDRTGYVVEVDAGSDAPVTAGVATASDVALQEAYLTVMDSNNKLGLKAGKFATFHGIEVIESPANPTITRGYLYGLAEPFTHVGAVVSYLAGMMDFHAGVINGWDVPNDNNPGKTLVGKVGFNFGDPLSFGISGHHGPEQAAIADDPTTPLVDETDNRSGANRTTVDLTGVTKIIPNVDLWFQALFGQEEQALDKDGDTIADDLAKFSGFTIQPVINITDRFSVGARGEYFHDDGSRTGTMNLAARNFAITPAYKVTDSVTVRAELRQDSANKKVWQDDKGVTKDSTSSATLQAVVTF